MNFIQDLKVKQKLVLLLCIVLVSLVGVGGVGYYFLNKTNANMHVMYAEKLMAVELVNGNMSEAHKIESDIQALILTTDNQEETELRNDIDKRADNFDKNLAQFEKMPMSDTTKTQLTEIRADLAKYRSVRQTVLTLAQQGQNGDAYALFKAQGKPVSDKFMNELAALADSINQSADDMNAQNEKDFTFANITFSTIIIIGIILAFSLGWLITKQISSRMTNVVDFLDLLASGDFSTPVPPKSMNDKSEFGAISRAVDSMQNSVKNLLSHLLALSEQLATSSTGLTASAEQSAQASNQIAGSVTQVADGAERQLKLTNSADNLVKQISAAINQVAENTQTVSGSADKTAETANNGEGAITHAVDQMKIIENKTNSTASVIGELEEKSKQIGQIVDVISSIAGQTNLLALNAAIEAARAGEAGKGFAVVAEEVRKLAEQSQDAAKQITDLIGQVQAKTDDAVTFMADSKNEVDTGASVVSSAGSNFKQILHMVKDMTEQIREISASIEEVTGHAQNVVSAVQEIDGESKKASEETQNISAATQEQSASVEEIASSSQKLSQMADELRQAVRKFKI
ncbi:methyl-accepting chemotaxis protein [Pectinatus cerevisiiphilus]|uniref:Methyl-accepting chemotaxis protein n=1 Tax=Pectinatus cerevisiiphilus TaxID=86956 RepID=A0A4R3KH81_9FIRM|nr:HAMP domain-containing methyl-accepting chemotaxis protein [Pectinatus cerevisiiphilus]TCS82031.1 methyl-accepting chemotaxis protein [Pectinatus cerevisiiphilus]